MNRNITIIMVALGAFIAPFPAAAIPLPAGFEDIFNARQDGVVDLIYGDISLGSVAVEYDRQEVLLLSPGVVVEQITAADMPPLTLSAQALRQKLSEPLRRVNQQGFADREIVASLNESDASLRLIFPASLFLSADTRYDRQYISYRNQAGLVHSHNLNYLADSYNSSLSLAANETLNLTGNSYLKGAWSYSADIDFTLDELALYLESRHTRFKAGRQRLGDNLVDSTPSLTYSFFTPMSFDGVSLGYITSNYLNPGTGAASPVTVYLPQAGSVEIYRNGRMIDLQQFSAGLQHLDTRSWPSGGYDVLLVSRLANGSREEKIQPFFKRNGAFRSGELEYLLQLGLYDQRQGRIASRVNRGNAQRWHAIDNHPFAGASLGYTTDFALSLGGGIVMDNTDLYSHASMDIPVNGWFAERLYADGLYGNDGSSGYQVGIMKNLYRFGLNLSYRDNRFRGDPQDFRRFGVVPAYDFEYLQFGVNSFLPWNVGFGLSYGLNTFWQDYGRQHKSQFKSWDVNLNRDFPLPDDLNLRVDLGFHQGINEFISRNAHHGTTESRFFAHFTLGMRERSYNHYQSLYLRARLNGDDSDKNSYSADYSLNLDSPDFDRGGKYALTASASQGPNSEKHGGAGIIIDDRFGYHAAGFTRSFGNHPYNQFYFSQRSGFAVGEKEMVWGRMDNSAALIVDASALPADQYFDVRNRNTEPVVIRGGETTTLAMAPYQKIAPKAEQVFTGKTGAFYNLSVQAPSVWVMPGQVYRLKLAATKNQTVTGRLWFAGQPLTHVRVVGGNSISDEEGLFVGDFTMNTNDKPLTSLTVTKEGQRYVCPLLEKNVRMTQGIMQIRESKCEIQ
ncbi:CFA/I fimbrial subunit C [Mixta theicola]|uniref:CFA/I fimbrial subunit C n=1 Tax=Mixta theicola TaxID=1458355 RepID=A0A2K1Q9Z3_9GAMM|nr:TcfC E-set like domain-containing protein [Mixta theicola]PNS11850.1 CFA/I fimbrial subunit C [Mixta theicola]GLR07778.1 fimbrial usher protein [Mixta theicola]